MSLVAPVAKISRPLLVLEGAQATLCTAWLKALNTGTLTLVTTPHFK